MKWKKKLLSRKWFIVNEDVAYNRTVDCVNAVELQGIYIYKNKYCVV
jgi:hypothetical protein